MVVIYTIGSSLRTIEEFISILKTYSIETVVDVRSFPTSRFEHFKKENFAKHLRKEGLEYIYLGKELGGYRPEGYEKFMEKKEFKMGVAKVKELAHHKKIALMCAEKFPWKCHRLQIASFIEKDITYKFIHILEKDKTWEPAKSTKKSQI